MDHFGTAANEPREQTFSEKAITQLQNVNSELETAGARLDKLFSLRFGHRPEPPASAAKLQSVPSNTSAEILEAVSSALSRAYAINGLISDLERAF